MVLEIITDTEYKFFDAVTKDKRFDQYPKAFYGRGGRTVCTTIDRKNWYKDLEEIASWVNNNLREEDGTPEACIFALG